MARTKKLANYGSELAELVEACCVQGRTIRVRADNRRDAWRIQGRFYSWRKALSDALLDAEVRPESYEQSQVAWMRNCAGWAAKTTCFFEQAMPTDAPRDVVFSSVENTDMSQKLRAALDAAPAPGQSPAGAQASLQRILDSLPPAPELPDDAAPPLPTPKKYY